MNKKKILAIIGGVTVMAISISAFTLVNNNGGQTFETGSPFDGGNCSGCHGGGSATCTPTFTASPAFGSGNTYIPNATYTISVGETGYPDFGFDLEIINSNSSTAACVDIGTFSTAVSGCQIIPSSGNPTNVTQTSRVATASKASFKWKAPATGACYVYMCMNGVNGNGSTNGDKPTNFAVILNPSPAGINSPVAIDSHLSFYPNPATDMLNLSYSLDKRSTVSIQIFDLAGKQVANLFNETLEAGEQKYVAHLPSDMAKGTYMLNLIVDGQPTVKKLMIK
jgi:hypothetical protein